MTLRELFSRKRVCHLLVNPEGEMAKKYSCFMDFLDHNRAALGVISELERLYYGGGSITMGGVASQYQKLGADTVKVVEALNCLAPGKYQELFRVYERLHREIMAGFTSPSLPAGGELVLPLEALGPEMVMMAGSKAVNLAIMQNVLSAPIPPGFVITVPALELFLQETGLAAKVAEMLAGLSQEDLGDLEEKSGVIREMILQAQVPGDLAEKIYRAYQALEAKTHPQVRLAMRSSAVGEDSEASFAGQYVTELNVTRENLLEAYKTVVAGKYSPRAISYRRHYGLEDRDTHMSVAAIVMIDSRASGVLYTVDPSRPESNLLKINSIWGLGEYLVSGEAPPDEFYVDKTTGALARRVISRKERRLVNLAAGGTGLEEVPEVEKDLPSLTEETVLALARYGLQLEEHFQGPQDVEWAVDQEGRLYLLQSRPLSLTPAKEEEAPFPQDFPGHPVLLTGGQAASPGIAAGTVFLADGDPSRPLPEDAILVARTASPEYARFMGRIKGIITDMGSVTSHLASVAREFGVPALFNTGRATASLPAGAAVTLVAEQGLVHQGIVPELAAAARPGKRHMVQSPVHQRMRAFLDRVAPLNLTDPEDPAFSPGGCQTLHDLIRFTHEKVMREMFGLAGEAGDGVLSVRLITDIPLVLHLIDLGGGLEPGLTTCHEVTAAHLESVPMRALWKGFCHPGITWSGGVAVDARNFMQLMARGAMQGPENLPGGDSYAILSREYLNLSAKFGYHFANLDALVSDTPDQNYITLQFAGGAGSYYGKSLRLNFLGNILTRLGCKIHVTGDLLDASLTGYERASLEETLEQVGRLLACSRLLDMALTNEAEMQRMIEGFFQGDYDFLHQAQEIRIPGFYTHTGNWRRVEEEGRVSLFQDGGDYGSSLSAGMATFMGKVMGHKYLELLDTIEAYFYFPLAIAKESDMGDGTLRVRVRPVAGSIDQAGGLACGLKNINNYFVFRINALEDNVMLFEYVNGQRLKRAEAKKTTKTGQWYALAVEIAGATLRGYVDGELLIDYTGERPITGYVGLWTKADAVTMFAELSIEAGGQKRMVEF